jgi:hypothetical protein
MADAPEANKANQMCNLQTAERIKICWGHTFNNNKNYPNSTRRPTLCITAISKKRTTTLSLGKDSLEWITIDCNKSE